MENAVTFPFQVIWFGLSRSQTQEQDQVWTPGKI